MKETGQGLPRPLEAVLAALGLVVLAPLLAGLGLAVRLSSPGPVLFRQERMGRGGRLFTLLKFRTMRETSAGPRFTARGDARITGVGRFLRQSKLDELPELWNVLRGEMSFVGPRPEVPEYVDLEDSRWQRVLAARPGLTDPVTLALRNEEELLAGVAAEERRRFYAETLVPYKLHGYAAYLERRTAWSDLGVMMATLLAVVRPGRATPPSFEEPGGTRGRRGS